MSKEKQPRFFDGKHSRTIYDQSTTIFGATVTTVSDLCTNPDNGGLRRLAPIKGKWLHIRNIFACY